ncbi:hypothetical protein EDO6_05125 [Paenibacillus xylanexedens]|nr:hypothetical protein EDO6_05125 [Paenibacillus xylanexedens]
MSPHIPSIPPIKSDPADEKSFTKAAPRFVTFIAFFHFLPGVDGLLISFHNFFPLLLAANPFCTPDEIDLPRSNIPFIFCIKVLGFASAAGAAPILIESILVLSILIDWVLVFKASISGCEFTLTDTPEIWWLTLSCTLAVAFNILDRICFIFLNKPFNAGVARSTRSTVGVIRSLLIRTAILYILSNLRPVVLSSLFTLIRL